MSSDYPYTRNDLFAGEPFHYHYTAYQGLAFLEAYHRDRRRALEQLETLIGGQPMADTSGGEVTVAGKEPPFANPFARPVDTAAELAGAVSWITGGGDPGHSDLGALVTELVRKFEISKRLRSRYGEGFSVDVRDSAPLGAYCYLAFLVSQRPNLPDSLWHLNALLKLNDLVISAAFHRLDPGAARAFKRAIQRELAGIFKLARKKGIVDIAHAHS